MSIEGLTNPETRAAAQQGFLAALEVAEPSILDGEGKLLAFARDDIEGLHVSIDLGLPGKNGAEHRFFGTVTEVMSDSSSKGRAILLVQDAKPNEPIDVDVVARAIANDERVRKGHPPVPDTFPVDQFENPEHYRAAAKAAIRALGLER